MMLRRPARPAVVVQGLDTIDVPARPGIPLEFGRHRLVRPAARVAPAWPTDRDIRARLDQLIRG